MKLRDVIVTAGKEKYSLEVDLLNSISIKEKCSNVAYAQNLYAALCNNEFVKNDLWSVLKDERWSCSWRYAGEIISSIREEGDYLDFYCSGILHMDITDEIEYSVNDRFILPEDKKIIYHYVPESMITDEIKRDLLNLGWKALPSHDCEEWP
jgi:hypothetical protein